MFFHGKAVLESSGDEDLSFHYESFTQFLVNNQRSSSVSEVSVFEPDISLAKLHKVMLIDMTTGTLNHTQNKSCT